MCDLSVTGPLAAENRSSPDTVPAPVRMNKLQPLPSGFVLVDEPLLQFEENA
jgi:hypothetical protein